MDALTIEGFYSAAREGKILGLRCNNGHTTAPPRHSCSTCRSTELKTIELTGRGTVISFTVVHVKSQEFPLETPFILALTRLDEGPRLLGVLDAEPNVMIQTGDKVRVLFKQIPVDSPAAGWPRIFFQLLD
jgi:uncharacterized protein